MAITISNFSKETLSGLKTHRLFYFHGYFSQVKYFFRKNELHDLSPSQKFSQQTLDEIYLTYQHKNNTGTYYNFL